jgi:conjugal transfer pilus assembly protein TraE
MMRLDIYQNKTSNVWAQNRLLKFVVAVIGLSSVVSIFMAIHAINRQKVVILPPVVDKRIVITGNDVNDDYIKLFVRYTLGLLLNYSPTSFNDQADDCLKFAAPEFYQQLHKKLATLKETVKKLNISNIFYPERIKVYRDEQRIEVLGIQRQYAQHALVDEGTKTYEIRYEIIQGRFFLTGIKEITTG